MKFPIDECVECGLDLTTAEPVEVKHLKDEMTLASCPGCLRPYIMVEVTPPSPEPEVEPEAEPEPVAEPVAEAVAESTPESEPETSAEPEAEPEE